MNRIQDMERSAASRPDASARVDSVAAPRRSDIAEKAGKILAGFDFQNANRLLNGLFKLTATASEVTEKETEREADEQAAERLRERAVNDQLFACGIECVLTPVKIHTRVGCWNCFTDREAPYKAAPFIRNKDGKHYLVVIDANGCEAEYEIWYCPYCGEEL